MEYKSKTIVNDGLNFYVEYEFDNSALRYFYKEDHFRISFEAKRYWNHIYTDEIVFDESSLTLSNKECSELLEVMENIYDFRVQPDQCPHCGKGI